MGIKGDLLMRSNRLDDALDSLYSVLEEDPKNGIVRAYLSLLKMSEGEIEESSNSTPRSTSSCVGCSRYAYPTWSFDIVCCRPV